MSEGLYGPTRFYKMCGSGNDFVFVNAMDGLRSWATDAQLIQRLCDRRRGVGADGIVYLAPAADHSAAEFAMIYLNSDGSRAAFCGNAALCAVRLATRLGIVSTAEFGFETDYGLVRGRLHTQGNPEVELPAVTGFQAVYDMPLAPGELRAGLGTAGVPHLVILCADAERVDLSQRGPFLRRLAALGPEGANVNFISAASDAVDSGWRMRTYERGVEGETMACGSGAVVSALLARSWSGETVAGTASSREVVIHTSAGLPLVVRPLGGTEASGSTSSGGIALRGEGRLVFEGHLRDY